MFRFVFACFFLFAAGLSAAELPLSPRPASVEVQAGSYLLKDGSAVALQGIPQADFLLSTLSEAAKMKFVQAGNGTAPITFVLKKASQGTSPEAYSLEISSSGIRITGDEAGLFYGAKSLGQIVSGASKADGAAKLDNLKIHDSPRYGWRGFMLDESRHFSGEAAVKRLLDAMAHYKMNRFHWHLTDSPGWRIEIKKYPRLTSVGGRGSETDRSPNAPAEFYTQEQIRDIVAYAKQRHILVIPEIDMPGHADAANIAYPENDGGGFRRSGDKWIRFTFNPAKAETLEFLDNILKEVAELFPDAKIIHFGGDEVNFGWKQWDSLPEVQELMKKENLKDKDAVEGWFNRRMAGVINSLGFKVAGWDEIATRGLAKDKTIVYWWRHDKPQVMRKALADGYPVVLCPRRPMYLDFIQQKEHKVGRVWGGFNPLPDVYNFPAALKLTEAQERNVLGVNACLWAEVMRDQERRDFMTWPRLVAVAESGWTPADRKDYASFEARLKPELDSLKARGFVTLYDPFEKSPEVRDKKEVKALKALDQPD
ncbi:MAG: beta-N-acetylhexosaminidase [Puniceicoccales bacterium]|jgi:hexosaminidase|nr:beta-N-acetylhexosaminidase [Puniceicoccales bacterium]